MLSAVLLSLRPASLMMENNKYPAEPREGAHATKVQTRRWVSCIQFKVLHFKVWSLTSVSCNIQRGYWGWLCTQRRNRPVNASYGRRLMTIKGFIFAFPFATLHRVHHKDATSFLYSCCCRSTSFAIRYYFQMYPTGCIRIDMVASSWYMPTSSFSSLLLFGTAFNGWNGSVWHLLFPVAKFTLTD